MKNRVCIFSLLLVGSVLALSSCKQKLTNVDAYDLYKDTIAPVLSVTVPVNLDSYLYGEDIHIVGTATDLMARNNIHEYAGKLKSLSFTMEQIDPLSNAVIKVMYAKSLAVDGKSGYIFNDGTSVLSGSGTLYCRLTGVLTDYADRKDSSIANFTIHN